MQSIQVSKDRSIATVTLNRPQTRNSMDRIMISELTDAFRVLSEDMELAGVCVRGAGDAFCAGADLNWMKEATSLLIEENIRDAEELAGMLETVQKCPHPLIAHVHGYAVGGGIGLLSVCDVVAMDAATKLAFSEVRLGIVPAIISPFVLSKISQGHARELMITGRWFTAEEAWRMGLAHYMGDAGNCQKYLDSILEMIRLNGPQAMRTTKHLISYVLNHNPEEVRQETVTLITERRLSAEAQTRLVKFLEKKSK